MVHRELKISVAGAAVAVAVLLALSRASGVDLSDLYSVPPHLLGFSLAVAVLRLASQALRFYLIVGAVGRVSVGLREAIVMRGASEFFALTTVPFVADEAARAAMLARRGERPMAAFWIATAELVVDVAVSAPLAAVAGLYAAAVGSWAIASAVLAVSVLQLAGVSLLTSYAGREGQGSQGRFSVLLPPAIRRRMSDGVAEMRRVLGSLADPGSLPRTAAVATASLAVATLPSVVLAALSGDLSAEGLIRALFSTMAGNALGVLPVSVGGAGVTEAGVFLYASGVYGISDWEAVLRWRLLTYYLTLAMTGALLALYLLGLRRPGRT
ncbi:MAG: lysylphosphatidylglycerol synthase domain-containing protein [Candidatus Caldarchaeales archaeon]